MPDPTLQEILLRKAQTIGPQPQNALGQDLPLPEGQDYPSSAVEFLRGLVGSGEGHKTANAVGQLLGAVAPLGMLGREEHLATDLASRMKRAEQMGFNKDVFHGTRPKLNREEPGIGSGNFTEFEYKRPYGDAGIHVDPDPKVANVAASDSIRYLEGPEVAAHNKGSNVLALKARAQRPLDLPDMAQWSDPHQWQLRLDPTKRWANKDIPKDPNLTPIYDELYNAAKAHATPRTMMDTKAMDQAESQWAERFKNILKRNGYDSIRYPNTSEGTGGPSYMLLDPNQLRSKNALFDPARAKSGDLLASILAALGLGTMTQKDEKP